MQHPTPEELSTLREQLRQLITGPVVIVGVGNELRGDDALGVLLAERLEGRVNATIIIGQDVPENFAVQVAQLRPALVLLLDAADMGLQPGSVRLLPAEQAPAVPGGTHRPSLEMFAAFVRLESGAPSYIVGVQPDMTRVDMGSEMSPAVQHAIERVAEVLVEMLPPG